MMETSDFKENILKLLSATNYSLNLKTDQLSSLEVDTHLKPFFDWFTLNVSEENCVTNDELKKFKELEDKNKVMYNEELDEALHHFQNQVQDLDTGSQLPPAELFMESLKEEIIYAREELDLKTKLLSTVENSTSAITDDISEIRDEKMKAMSRKQEVLKSIFNLNRVFNEKLLVMKQSLDELRERLSELDVSGEISADEGIDTLKSDKLNCSMMSVSSIQSIALNKESTVKLFCQLPFHHYQKQHKYFCKTLEKLAGKKKMDSGDANINRTINVAKPTRQPFMNFVQHFWSHNKGEARSVKEIAVMAGEAWSKMSDQEKAPYRVLADTEKQKPRAEVSSRKLKSSKFVLKAKLKAMKSKLAELNGVVKRLKRRPRPLLRKQSAVPPHRRIIQNRFTRKRIGRPVHQSVGRTVLKVVRKQASRRPNRVTFTRSSPF